MKKIRLATKEEIDAIRDKADLDFTQAVWAFPHNDGAADIAVERFVPELDPVIFAPATDDRRKAMFIWGMENIFLGRNVAAYYFNVDAKNEKWINVVKSWGAEQLSPNPELRFKMTIGR